MTTYPVLQRGRLLTWKLCSIAQTLERGSATIYCSRNSPANNNEENFMRGLKLMLLAGAAAFCFTVTAPQAAAQVSVSVGVEPDCPYGYYDAVPYGCAPAGYYGPEWFNGGVFIGSGPWFHGPENFHGSVNNRYHPEHGYKGPTPNRGEKAEPAKRVDSAHFKGNEQRDGRGHTTGGKK
jgi:hypothetical protein